VARKKRSRVAVKPLFEGLEARLLLSAEIHGAVWNDANANGSWDTDELGLAGVTVFLDDDNNGLLDTGETSVITDTNGDYSFIGLSKGDYIVAQVLQLGWQQTFPTPAPASHAVSLKPNKIITGIDFGDYSPLYGLLLKLPDFMPQGVFPSGE